MRSAGQSRGNCTRGARRGDEKPTTRQLPVGSPMTIRTPAAAAVLTLLGLAADNRACAQPVVPRRPQVSAYQSLFYPYSQPYGPGAYSWNRATGPTVPLAPGYLAGPYTGPYPAGYASPYGAPYGATGSVFGPAYAGGVPWVTGQPVVFNYLGPWYSNYYGHWYPNGI